MMYFTERGKSHQDVLKAIKDKYGSSAKILSHKTVPMGGFLGLFQKDGVEYSGYISGKESTGPNNSIQKEKEKLLEVLNKTKQKNDSFDEILKEVRSLKEEIQNREPVQVQKDDNPVITRIEDLLLENDFNLSYIRKITDRLRNELTFQQLEDIDFAEDTVLKWIEESIELYEDKSPRGVKIFILVGPTGVGKTTTIAKLAAINGIGTSDNPPKKVRMITIDNYRIAARKQIETYGEIMGIPVDCSESYEDLKKDIDSNRDADIIFVDTIGKSPRDYIKLAEMRRMLEGCGAGCEVHLALSATTKTSDIKEIMKQFDPFGYESVIITKFDETTRSGSLISLLAEQEKTVSYITDGQMVPQDIEKASKEKLLSLLTGFKINSLNTAGRS